jgi:hypothetical protein
VLAIYARLWLQRTEYFWRNPLQSARFQTVTDFDGVEQMAVARQFDREQEIIEALKKLVVESQRLIQRHQELLDDYDRLAKELDEIRRKRR